MNTHEIRVTGDGSKTIFLPELNETYHSSNGAVQESRHIFIQNGLDLVVNKGNIKPASTNLNLKTMIVY